MENNDSQTILDSVEENTVDNVQEKDNVINDNDIVENVERASEGVLASSNHLKELTKKPPIKVGLKALAIVLGAFIYTAGIKIFVTNNGFITGGVWGIALMLEHVFGIPNGYMILALNVPLLILSVIFLGWKFTAYTFLFIGVQSGLSLLSSLFNIPSFTDDRLLAAVAGSVFMGAGQALCLKVGGCTGGTDIASIILQRKKIPLNVPWVIFMINAVIISAAYFVYGGLSAVILSLILEFLASKVSDTILSGFSAAIRFEIVTSKGEEIQNAIINKLGSGATVIEARGGYTNDKNYVIICLIHRRQLTAFKRLLKEADPTAFAYISSVSSVLGKGFTDINKAEQLFYIIYRRAVGMTHTEIRL